MAATQPWHRPTPGPIAVLTPPAKMRSLTRQLRLTAARHDDTAWVHPRPPTGPSSLTSVGIDILDAIGAVGIRQPPSHGESHLLRPLVHLVHGPVRHLVIDDAAHIDTETLTELHQVGLIATTQLWLLVDTAERAVTREGDFLEWVNDTCTIRTPDQAAAQWTARPHDGLLCDLPDPGWWHRPLTGALPLACERHRPHPPVACFLSWTRRAFTANHAAAATIRRRLNDWLNHPQATEHDHWAATAAAREFYTAGADALAHLDPSATLAMLRDVTPDGTTVTLADGSDHPVEPMKRAALARLRTSRTLSGCLDTDPVIGFFDNDFGL